MTTSNTSQSETIAPRTTCVIPFSQYNCAGDTLFSVRAGIPHDDALEQASCLLSIALESLGHVVRDHDSETAGGAKRLVEMAKALVDAVTGSEYQQPKPSPAKPAAPEDGDSPMDEASARAMAEKVADAVAKSLMEGAKS